jgi:hypothetical protein
LDWQTGDFARAILVDLDQDDVGFQHVFFSRVCRSSWAKVTAVDAEARKVALEFVDGTSDTVTVCKPVDLSKVSPGDSVTARLTESVAIAVEKT